MRKLFLVSIVILSSIVSFAQASDSLIGKWKIISIDAGIYYNYKLDSTSIPDEIKMSLKNSKDSLLTISLIKGMIQEFEKYYYDFFADGTFKETKDGKMKQEGNYIVNTKGKECTLIVKTKFNGENRQKLNYKIVSDVLEFIISSDDGDLKFSLERAN